MKRRRRLLWIAGGLAGLGIVAQLTRTIVLTATNSNPTTAILVAVVITGGALLIATMFLKARGQATALSRALPSVRSAANQERVYLLYPTNVATTGASLARALGDDVQIEPGWIPMTADHQGLSFWSTATPTYLVGTLAWPQVSSLEDETVVNLGLPTHHLILSAAGRRIVFLIDEMRGEKVVNAPSSSVADAVRALNQMR